MDETTLSKGLVDIALQSGPVFTLVVGFAFVYVKIMLPNQLKRDEAREALITRMMQDQLARDAEHEKQLTKVIDDWRSDESDRIKEYLDRENAMREQLKEQDARTMALLRDQDDRFQRERDGSRTTFDNLAKALEALNSATRQNAVLIFSLAENLNVPKQRLAEKANSLGGPEIDKSIYDTKDNTGKQGNA